MENPGFIGIDYIRNTYLPMGFSHFKIEGRSLGSSVILEFLLYYMTKHVFALETIQRVENAPPHHDSFDRMMIAQAKAENYSFVTHDSMIPHYKEKCIVPV